MDELFTKIAEQLATWLGTELVKVSLDEVWECTNPVEIDKGFLSHYANARAKLANNGIYLTVTFRPS